MAAKLISLRDVPDEEAEGICEMLTRHHIDFYVTPHSRWGISAPIIWIEDELQLERAKALLDNFQEAWTERERAAYTERVANNQQPTLLGTPLQHPIRMLALLAFAGVIAYFSIVPFIELGQ